MNTPEKETPIWFYAKNEEHFGTFIKRHNIFVDLDSNCKFVPEEVESWHYVPHKQAKELIDYNEFTSRKNACY